jgi:hypothetical protein
MKVLKPQLELLITGIIFITLSIIALIIFGNTGKYIIHPAIYFVTLLMGLGWTITGIDSIINFNNKTK